MIPDELRQRVLAAAGEELTRWGIDRFSIASLCDRNGIDPAVVRQRWPAERELILEVFQQSSSQSSIPPDTGSLRTDLAALALGMGRYLHSDLGRSLQSAHLIANPDLPSAELRQVIWRSRVRLLAEMFHRARQRDELVDGIEPETVLELLFAPIHMRSLFTGQPVDDEYCHTVAYLVWRAVAAPTTG
jgi:AcrR family transcriptional regulator